MLQYIPRILSESSDTVSYAHILKQANKEEYVGKGNRSQDVRSRKGGLKTKPANSREQAEKAIRDFFEKRRVVDVQIARLTPDGVTPRGLPRWVAVVSEPFACTVLVFHQTHAEAQDREAFEKGLATYYQQRGTLRPVWGPQHNFNR